VLACVFALLSIFTLGIVFVPLAALCCVVGLLLAMLGRSGSGFAISLVGGVLTATGFALSPSLWLLTGGLLLVVSQKHEVTATKSIADANTNRLRG
jgi:hypothetical protein